ncbi:chromate transporter [Anaerovorax odorimutans]|uniref:Chromate transporter n=1 Tax=Anaerovorax odorimutans TaxID=109327 RepID=A0ABT1RK65_9FIRM|nr:chromate transporter [Anaerovorax odorimutans]MCQ4635569.1 chromate transporter [Anaerovorax odorimutans]
MAESKKKAIKEHASLFWEFFKIGLFTIGGGMAMLPLIQKVAVEDKKWMDAEDMIDCLAVSQAMPGVIAINSATYIGRRRRGLTGSLAATLGVILPSFLIIIAVVSLLGTVGQNRYVEGAFTGVKAAVCGLVIVSACKLGKQVLRDPFAWTLAILAFLAIAVFRITALWAIIVGAVAGILYLTIREHRRAEK